jgi:DNA invertase Pin-like site-specific DNA recombinase
MKHAAIYIRVSSSKKVAPPQRSDIPTWTAREEDKFLQNPKVQLEPLIALIKSRGWSGPRFTGDRDFTVYEDRMTGASTSRPGYKRLMEDARRGKFQVVVVWRFDRFARSTKELLGALEEFRSLGIDFVSQQEAIDTSTPAGKMMFTIIAAFAEFERAIMRDRIMAGLEYAANYGTKSGKPIGGQRKIFNRDDVLMYHQNGLSVRAIAEKLGVGLGTVHRTLKAFQNHVSEKRRTETAGKDLRER